MHIQQEHVDPQRILHGADGDQVLAPQRSAPAPPDTSAHHSYNLYTSFTTRFSASEPVEYYIQKIRIFKPRPNKFRPFVGRLVQIRTFFTGTADLVSEHFFPPFGPTSPPIFGGPAEAENDVVDKFPRVDNVDQLHITPVLQPWPSLQKRTTRVSARTTTTRRQ